MLQVTMVKQSLANISNLTTALTLNFLNVCCNFWKILQCKMLKHKIIITVIGCFQLLRLKWSLLYSHIYKIKRYWKVRICVCMYKQPRSSFFLQWDESGEIADGCMGKSHSGNTWFDTYPSNVCPCLFIFFLLRGRMPFCVWNFISASH